MFGKIIYYDKKTIDEYKSIINGRKSLEIGEYQVANDRGVGFDFRAVSADTKATKKYTAKVIESMLYDCAEFEKMLYGRDDYFDFTQSSEYDMSTIQRGCIIKLDSYLEIPEPCNGDLSPIFITTIPWVTLLGNFKILLWSDEET